MDERLTQEQRELVEKNLTVIDCVIRSCVHANNNICGMEYDDLYQIGAIGLCKAASRYKPVSYTHLNVPGATVSVPLTFTMPPTRVPTSAL